MDEGERFFQGTSETHKALKRITQKLGGFGIDYVVVGGMAMFQHGYRRFTEDVDLLVTRDGLKEVHAKLEGLGYRPPFDGSKHLRDTEHGVKIEFLVTGGYSWRRETETRFVSDTGTGGGGNQRGSLHQSSDARRTKTSFGNDEHGTS